MHNDVRRQSRSRVAVHGRDWQLITRFQRENSEESNVRRNHDFRPTFSRRPARRVERASLDDFVPVRDDRRSGSLDSGDPNPACNDVDGIRNDAGFTGGPFVVRGTYPTYGDCGMN
jgi:hypothetical protein